MNISTQHHACLDVPKMVKKYFSFVWLPTVAVLNLEKMKVSAILNLSYN